MRVNKLNLGKYIALYLLISLSLVVTAITLALLVRLTLCGLGLIKH